MVAMASAMTHGADRADAYTGTLQQRLVANMHETHRLQDRLRAPRTPFGYRPATVYSVNQWRLHRLLWQNRQTEARWAYRAIWPSVEWPTLRCVVQRESGWNPMADNPTSSANGLMQILGGPYGVVSNYTLGLTMYHEAGWTPWRGGSPSCGIS